MNDNKLWSGIMGLERKRGSGKARRKIFKMGSD